MTDAVIVSTARTRLAKSWRGALNMTHGATLGGPRGQGGASSAPSSTPAEVEDVIMGCANPEGRDRRQHRAPDRAARRLPVTVSGMTVNRFCSSGLQTIALASQRILAGEARRLRRRRRRVDFLRAERSQQAHGPGRVAEGTQARDLLEHAADRRAGGQALQDRPRSAGPLRRAQPAAAAKARSDGKFKDEIVPITTTMKVVDKNTNVESTREVTASEDEGIRPDTTYEGVS